MELSLHDFFRAILPETGYYAYITKEYNQPYPKHKVIKNLDTFLGYIGIADAVPTDRYFGLASYTQGYHEVYDRYGNTKKVFRTQDNVDKLKCLFADIDVGADKPYATTRDAVLALREFLSKTNLPMPGIVKSGSGGIHLYWAFDKSITRDEWRILACRLHSAFTTHNFQADPARTRDCASILRMPFSYNYKGSEPKLVELIAQAKPRPVELYKECLSSYDISIDTGSRTLNDIELQVQQMDFEKVFSDSLDTIDRLAKEDTLAAKLNVIYPTRPAEEVVAQCLQIQKQKNAPEPVWRGMLSVLRHCENGEEIAHKLSAQDDRYDYADTQMKLDDLADKRIAPYTCNTFHALRPEVCEQCPHRGVINSPISVPVSKIKTVDVSDNGEISQLLNIDVEVDTETTKRVVEQLTVATAKFRVNDTGCYHLEYDKQSNETKWVRFYPYPVYPIQRIRDKNAMGETEVSYIFRKHKINGYDDFQIGGEVLLGQGLYPFLGSVGFLLQQEERKLMGSLMIDLLSHLEGDLEETKMANNLGWDENLESFLLGNKLYKTNGTVVEITPKGVAAPYSNLTVPRGSLDTWKSIANVYNKKGLEWGQVALASAFASPLMPIGALERAALLFITGEKGVGKSTALMLAVSVFGNPTQMMINKDDTYLARLQKLGIMNNISAGFDEMTDLSPREASELAYQITQGRGKDRMGDGGKALLVNNTFWSCLPVMSANDSIINALSLHSHDATAQMSRVLEVKAKNINEVYSRDEFYDCEALVRSLPNTYGLAGDVYMRWVTANMPTVKVLLQKVEHMFLQRTKLDSTLRFWTYMCTRMIAGIIIANKLGLVQYDVENFIEYLTTLIEDGKRKLFINSGDVATIFPQFMSSTLGSRLVVKSDERTTVKFDPSQGVVNDLGYVIHSPAVGRELMTRISVEERICDISISAAKEWCAKREIPYDRFVDSIKLVGHLESEKTRTAIGRLTQYHDIGRINCIRVRLPEDMDLGLDVEAGLLE